MWLVFTSDWLNKRTQYYQNLWSFQSTVSIFLNCDNLVTKTVENFSTFCSYHIEFAGTDLQWTFGNKISHFKNYQIRSRALRSKHSLEYIFEALLLGYLLFPVTRHFGVFRKKYTVNSVECVVCCETAPAIKLELTNETTNEDQIELAPFVSAIFASSRKFF